MMKIRQNWKILYILFWIISVCLALFWNTSLDVTVVFLEGFIFATLLLILNPAKLENMWGILIEAVIITSIVYLSGAIPIGFLCNYGYALHSCINNHLNTGYPLLLFSTSLYGVMIALGGLYFSLRHK